MRNDDNKQIIKPTDLRGILNYVPRFLGQTFVISMDGSIIEHENLPNLLLDIAVLRSLQINIVIVHGISKQLCDLATSRREIITDSAGNGITDSTTLDLAIRASSRVSHQILEALTKANLKCAITNSVRAKPVGIIRGIDLQYTGKAEQIDNAFIDHLISKNIIPIIQPIGFDRDGHTLRINSDQLAADIAIAIGATKVVYLGEENGFSEEGALTRQIPTTKLEALVDEDEEDEDPMSSALFSKAMNALYGIKRGISRIHILDGRIHDGLICEIFSNEGVGTLIYGNEYQQIRKATRDDVSLLYHLTRSGIAKEELLNRNIESIEEKIDLFYLYEVDGNIMACILLDRYDEDPTAREISSLFVHPLYQKQGIGQKLVNFACRTAEQDGAKHIVALSTQSYEYFKSILGFEDADVSILPEIRQKAYNAQKRKSKVLVKKLPQSVA